jgi:hypothetical protein
MATNCPDNESSDSPLKSESARKRWEMFHRAIAHAKQSTSDAMQEEDGAAGDSEHARPLLTIVR